MSDLRTRIAKTIWRTFQNTPPIEATDEEWEKWWVQGGDHEQKFYYMQADAVIAELQPELNRHDTGCVCQNCWFNHYGEADDDV